MSVSKYRVWVSYVFAAKSESLIEIKFWAALITVIASHTGQRIQVNKFIDS